MEHAQVSRIVERILRAIQRLVPKYAGNPADQAINAGNAAVCVLRASGTVRGALFGDDKLRKRNSFRIAWMKASQAWVTEVPTGKYEEMVYTRQVDWRSFGIPKPELIGWEGGMPVAIDADTRIYVGFSGFRAETDAEIIREAAREVLGRDPLEAST